jgi:hypothetical protein
MALLALILLFIGAILMAIGANTPAIGCTRIGTILLAVGFGVQLFAGYM